jgi:hypothetical protein
METAMRTHKGRKREERGWRSHQFTPIMKIAMDSERRRKDGVLSIGVKHFGEAPNLAQKLNAFEDELPAHPKYWYIVIIA